MAGWTIEDVAVRFEETASTERHLPPACVQGYFNTRPVIVCKEWETSATNEHVYRPFPLTPDAIDRMLETMCQVQWLEIEQCHLAWTHAKRYGWRDTTIRFACDYTAARCCWRQALEIIVEKLNSEDICILSKTVGQAE